VRHIPKRSSSDTEDGFPEEILDHLFTTNGKKLSIPKKRLKAAVERAAVFGKQNAGKHKSERGSVLVSLAPKRMRITGSDDVGSYLEKIPIKYSGTKLKLEIELKMLQEVAKRTNEYRIAFFSANSTGLVAINDDFNFVSSVTKLETTPSAKPAHTSPQITVQKS
jgi:DNA polymerase III sliding clamp (beta) subunit (PCNA family)